MHIDMKRSHNGCIINASAVQHVLNTPYETWMITLRIYRSLLELEYITQYNSKYNRLMYPTMYLFSIIGPRIIDLIRCVLES